MDFLVVFYAKKTINEEVDIMNEKFSNFEKGLEETEEALSTSKNTTKPQEKEQGWPSPFKHGHCQQWYEVYMQEAGDDENKKWAAENFLDHCKYLVDNMEDLTCEDCEPKGTTDEERKAWIVTSNFVKREYKHVLLSNIRRWKREGRTVDEIETLISKFSREFIKDFSAFLSERTVKKLAPTILR